MRKVAFYTLGCKLNFAETSTLARGMEEKGYQRVEFSDTPDIFIINTCSVTDNADKKCKKIVQEAKKISPDAYIAIVGCYAQLKPQEIVNIPGVDAVLGASEKFQLIELLDDFKKSDAPVVHHKPVAEVAAFNASYSLQDRTRSFLKIQDGCDYTCSFCTIPMARGKSRSDAIAHIVDQAKEIAHQGLKEVVLTGVNIGDFGLHDGKRVEHFFELMQALDTVEGIERFRISSIEPNLLTDEMIDWVSTSKKFVPHFHIPLQSGSDKILKLMRRRYLRHVHAERVHKIKSLMPHACVGADVIVGFPGETKEDFKDTYQFLNESPLSYLHVFSYSERTNTLAAEMPDKVHPSQKSERSQMLRILSEKKRRAFYEENIGSVVRVLFENDVKHDMIFGHAENYIKVALPYDSTLIGQILPIELHAMDADGVMLGRHLVTSV